MMREPRLLKPREILSQRDRLIRENPSIAAISSCIQVTRVLLNNLPEETRDDLLEILINVWDGSETLH